MKNDIKIDLINNYLKERNLSKTQFCKLCKISYSTLTNILNGDNFRLIALFKIAKILNIEVYQIFN